MPPDAHRDRILILDFGAQYTQLIARRIREQRVYCEIQPPSLDLAAHPRLRAGRASSSRAVRRACSRADAPLPDPGIFALGVPVLGICYGEQLMAQQLGGLVEKADEREYGRALLKLERDHPLFDGLPAAPSARCG